MAHFQPLATTAFDGLRKPPRSGRQHVIMLDLLCFACAKQKVGKVQKQLETIIGAGDKQIDGKMGANEDELRDVTDQIRVYEYVIGCIQRGEYLRLMVQASAGYHKHK